MVCSLSRTVGAGTRKGYDDRPGFLHQVSDTPKPLHPKPLNPQPSTILALSPLGFLNCSPGQRQVELEAPEDSGGGRAEEKYFFP